MMRCARANALTYWGQIERERQYFAYDKCFSEEQANEAKRMQLYEFLVITLSVSLILLKIFRQQMIWSISLQYATIHFFR